MLWYILRRIGSGFVLLFLVATFMFFLLQAAPGDPVQAMVGGYPVSDEYRAQMEEQFGLNLPLFERYVNYVSSLLQGDLGFSFAHRLPVSEVIMSRIGNTLILSLAAALIATVAGVGLGVLGAIFKGRRGDTALNIAALAGYSFPLFFLGQLLVLIFAVWVGWFPVQGMESMIPKDTPLARIQDVAWHLVLPAVALSMREIGVNIRMTRSAVVQTLDKDYMLTARAKGLPRPTAIYRHGLPNALLPIVTVIGYNLGYVLGGSVLIETVFAWPGIGRLTYESIGARDTPVIMGVFLTVAITVIIINAVTDALYGVLDPRIRSKK